jgi:uncharacterized membrane protein YeaQ/YmgE (transglycosylase-associated protein family)
LVFHLAAVEAHTRIVVEWERESIVRSGGNGGKTMNAKTIIIWLIVGAVAGWLAGIVVKGGGYGPIGNIIVGIVGGLIAGWLLPRVGVVGAIINAFIGAVILLVILRLIKI